MEYILISTRLRKQYHNKAHLSVDGKTSICPPGPGRGIIKQVGTIEREYLKSMSNIQNVSPYSGSPALLCVSCLKSLGVYDGTVDSKYVSMKAYRSLEIEISKLRDENAQP